MNPALDTLNKYHIPTHSYIAAVQSLTDVELTPEQYHDRIKELSGNDSTANEKHIRIHYQYLVQETVRRSMNSDVIDMDSIFVLATEHAEKYCDNNPWSFADRAHSDTPKVDVLGNVKPKKGAKKILAISVYADMVKENDGEFPSRKDAIERFVDEVKMTKAGASTYVANCKKNFGNSW